MNNDLKAVYNRFAEKYQDNRETFDMSEIFNDFFRKLNLKNGELLDLGCGTGDAFPKLFLKKGWNVTGVDFSEKMLGLAKKYQPEMKTVLSDVTEFDIKENKYNAITGIYSLFHVEKDKHRELFTKIFKGLKSGGKALFTYAGKEYTGSETFDGNIEFMGESLFYSHTTPEKLSKMLTGIGFSNIKIDRHEIGGETFLWVTVNKDRRRS